MGEDYNSLFYYKLSAAITILLIQKILIIILILHLHHILSSYCTYNTYNISTKTYNHSKSRPTINISRTRKLPRCKLTRCAQAGVESYVLCYRWHLRPSNERSVVIFVEGFILKRDECWKKLVKFF